MLRPLLIAACSFVAGVVLVAGGRAWLSGAVPPAGSAVIEPRRAAADEPADLRETTDYAPATNSEGPVWDVELVGHRDRGLVRDPGPNRPGEAESVLRIPERTRIRLRLTSRDYVYLLSLPRLRTSQVAVPGREFDLDFCSRAPGVFFIPGDHVCGPPTPTLTVVVHVEAKPDDPPRGCDR
jgi:hypothetical protein